MTKPLSELDIFMDALEQELNSVVRPGSSIAAEAVGRAKKVVEDSRKKPVEQKNG